MLNPTFKQFLTEQGSEDESSDNLSTDQIVDVIVQNCKPYLNAISNEPDDFVLYRGMSTKEPFVTKQVQENRRPLGMDRKVHDLVDSWMYDKFGVRFRSNAIFTSGHKGFATAFGHPYAIFPIGNFKIAWSPEVNDLFDALDVDNETATEENVDQALNDLNYQNSDLLAAIESGNEVMIHCDKYYAVRGAVFESDDIGSRIKKELN